MATEFLLFGRENYFWWHFIISFDCCNYRQYYPSLGRFLMGGCLVSIAVEFIGVILGWWIADALYLPLLFQVNMQGQQFPMLWSIIGGVIFVSVINLINRRR